MKRIEAIKKIISKVDDELIIATTGMISRELYYVKDRPENFYMCGSMGNALPVGLGLALNLKREIIVLDGDGAVLMGLGTLALSNLLGLNNLRHIILNNKCHASTGGQPTCFDALDISFFRNSEVINVEPGNIPDLPRIDLDPKFILERFIDTINKGVLS